MVAVVKVLTAEKGENTFGLLPTHFVFNFHLYFVFDCNPVSGKVDPLEFTLVQTVLVLTLY